MITSRGIIYSAWISTLTFILLFSCSAGGGGGDYSTAKVEDWQNREPLCYEEVVYNESRPFDFELFKEVYEDAKSAFAYVWDDGRDYWKTSCEAAEDLFGDCEDEAAYYYGAFRDAGWPDEDLWIVHYRLFSVSMNKMVRHAVCIVYFGPGEYDFYFLDGGYFLKKGNDDHDYEYIYRHSLFDIVDM